MNYKELFQKYSKAGEDWLDNGDQFVISENICRTGMDQYFLLKCQKYEGYCILVPLVLENLNAGSDFDIASRKGLIRSITFEVTSMTLFDCVQQQFMPTVLDNLFKNVYRGYNIKHKRYAFTKENLEFSIGVMSDWLEEQGFFTTPEPGKYYKQYCSFGVQN